MMIKNLLKLIIIANIGLIQAQYTAIPDFCFESHLIDLGIDSEGNYDGQILTSDINSITVLELLYTPCKITDLTGIQDFASLEILHAEFHELTAVDLSNNTELKELWIHSNMLTSLDISQNLKLIELHCSNNQIDTFTLGNNFVLEKLEISYNDISVLDISKLTNIWFLGCGHNLITNLDLRQNTNMEKLACNSNQSLTFFDIRNGNNTNISYINITETPNLSCIYVDDEEYSTENWSENIDPNSTFVETETECNALSVTKIMRNKLSIYPNPFNDILSLELDAQSSFDVTIYDMLGQKIITSNHKNIDTKNLTKGLYILKIRFENGRELMKRIMKIDA